MVCNSDGNGLVAVNRPYVLSDGGWSPNDDGTPSDDSAYPAWWQRNREECDAYNLRPYKPPRFTDETLVPPVISELETEFGVSVQLRVVNPQYDDTWTVHVDGDAIGQIEYERTRDGYTEYQLPASTFRKLVRNALTDDTAE